MSLIDRALTAYTRAHAVDPDFAFPDSTLSAPPAHLTLWRGRLISQLAAILGVDPVVITITRDTDRAHLDGHAQLLTVALTDPTPRQISPSAHAATTAGDAPETLRFIPVLGYEGAFAVLARCSDCQAPDVPVAAVTQLAELGAYLLDGNAPDNGLRHTLSWDPAHRPDCPSNTPDRDPTPT